MKNDKVCINVFSRNELDRITGKWLEFLQKVFGQEEVSAFLDFCGVRDNLKTPLFMPKGITLVRIVEEIKKRTPVELWIEEEEIPKVVSVRSSENETYALLHKGSLETDPDYCGRSALKIKGSFPFSPLSFAMTLEERLMFELEYSVIENNFDQM
ncbi:MAG: hypothetical protein QMD50_02580 [Patescibacteria group bacterium]|nr:hypothetical protein [Patescibacteria group bacterium]